MRERKVSEDYQDSLKAQEYEKLDKDSEEWLSLKELVEELRENADQTRN